MSLIEDFEVSWRSLPWRVGDSHRKQAGISAYVREQGALDLEDGGRLAHAAARLLLSSYAQGRRSDPLRVLQLGAGTGLFARQLLDRFRALCLEQGLDGYQRLQMLVTDASPAAVAAWHQLGLFEEHAGHVRPLVFDPADNLGLDGPLQAVFAVGVLGRLPAARVRLGPGQVLEQLCVRTRLREGETHPGATPDLAELRRLARSPGVRQLAALHPLAERLQLERAFRAQDTQEPAEAIEALRGHEAGAQLTWNHGALACAAQAVAALDGDGFLFIHDRAGGPDRDPDAESFAAATAPGIDFPAFTAALARRDIVAVTERDGEGCPVASCLAARRAVPATLAGFAQLGDDRRRQHGNLDAARAEVRAGRDPQARRAYDTALSDAAGDWGLRAEVAQFLVRRAGDCEAALALCREAVAINPWFSPWLWNVMGDALTGLGRHDEALAAHRQAERIDAEDARTNLSLAEALSRREQWQAALEVLERGLQATRTGPQREALQHRRLQLQLAAAGAGAAPTGTGGGLIVAHPAADTPASVARVVQDFHRDGFVKLKNAFAPDQIRQLGQFMASRYQQYYQEGAFAEATTVGHRRTMFTVELGGPVNTPLLYANPLVTPIVTSLLGTDVILGAVGAVVSRPGAKDQHVHRDHPGVLDESEPAAALLPPYAVTVIVPLVDLTPERGTTRMFVGSHKASNADAPLKATHDPLLSIGDCILMDYRTMHRGLANSSGQPRPLLYVTYYRSWFRDYQNFTTHQPLALCGDEYAQIPQQYRHLVDWVMRGKC